MVKKILLYFLEHDSDLEEDMKLNVEKVKKIAKKTMFRKPNMIKEDTESENEEAQEDDDVQTEDIKKAMRQAEISRFKENLEKRRKELEEYEKKKELTKSMSILERRMDKEINKQVISFSLEMQILE